jgi:hypothetical protein
MSKIDQVSEAIGELKSDIRDLRYYNEKKIGQDISKIEQHLKIQNSRIFKSEERLNCLENFKFKIIGYALGVSATVSLLIMLIRFIIK